VKLDCFAVSRAGLRTRCIWLYKTTRCISVQQDWNSSRNLVVWRSKWNTVTLEWFACLQRALMTIYDHIYIYIYIYVWSRLKRQALNLFSVMTDSRINAWKSSILTVVTQFTWWIGSPKCGYIWSITDRQKRFTEACYNSYNKYLMERIGTLMRASRSVCSPCIELRQNAFVISHSFIHSLNERHTHNIETRLALHSAILHSQRHWIIHRLQIAFLCCDPR